MRVAIDGMEALNVAMEGQWCYLWSGQPIWRNWCSGLWMVVEPERSMGKRKGTNNIVND